MGVNTVGVDTAGEVVNTGVDTVLTHQTEANTPRHAPRATAAAYVERVGTWTGDARTWNDAVFSSHTIRSPPENTTFTGF
eukprot:5476234-Prymnesium_polylepis.1